MLCRTTAECTGQTGLEMEALTACSVALLTIYDMCKAVDRGMTMGGVHLMEKRGGEERALFGPLNRPHRTDRQHRMKAHPIISPQQT